MIPYSIKFPCHLSTFPVNFTKSLFDIVQTLVCEEIVRPLDGSIRILQLIERQARFTFTDECRTMPARFLENLEM